MTTLNIRIDKKIKKDSAKILAEIGLDMTSAVKTFLSQVIVEGGLPFTPKRTPKEIRAEWDKEVAWALKYGKRYKSGEDLMADLLISKNANPLKNKKVRKINSSLTSKRKV
jgi:DNA-damage-inducible protein J